MKVDKHVAVVGFNICAAAFISLSAYGIFTYMSWDQAQAQSPATLTLCLYALAIAVCIAGICFFGIQMDRRRLEESKRR